MKYIVLVPDGMADEPNMAIGQRTPLEEAHTPNMDWLASQGLSGMVQTIPEGLPPGSDVGNLALMGYNPLKCYSGRAPLEAANMGVLLGVNDIAFRCNLVTIDNGMMADYSAGHISSEEAAVLIADLGRALSEMGVKFYPGKSYRHLMVITSARVAEFKAIKTTPPHDILNKFIQSYLPQGPQQELLLDLMEKSKAVLLKHPINQERVKQGLAPATMIWLWGQGGKPQLPLFKDVFGVSGSVISAVDLVNGIGRLAGLDVIDVPGANGYYDTNYAGKAEYGLNSLAQHDFIYIHIEAPDEAGHNGDWENKRISIEKIDELVVSKIIDYVKANPDTRVLISPDHPTPVGLRTHTRDSVPFILYGPGIPSNGGSGYSESKAKAIGKVVDSGEALLTLMFKV